MEKYNYGISIPQNAQNFRNLHTLQWYRTLAYNLIFSLIPVSTALFITDNEEHLTNITTELMIADWKWDGRGTKQGYRKQRATWAIYAIFNNPHHFKNVDDIGLNDPRQTTMLSNLDNQDQVTHLLQASLLTPKQKNRLCQYYFDGKTLEEIGQAENVSKQAINQSINKSLGKLRKAVT